MNALKSLTSKSNSFWTWEHPTNFWCFIKSSAIVRGGVQPCRNWLHTLRTSIVVLCSPGRSGQRNTNYGTHSMMDAWPVCPLFCHWWCWLLAVGHKNPIFPPCCIELSQKLQKIDINQNRTNRTRLQTPPSIFLQYSIVFPLIGTSYPKIATNFKSFYLAEIFVLLLWNLSWRLLFAIALS